MQNRAPAVSRVTYAEIALEACIVVGSVLMMLGVLLFALVSILGFEGVGWALVGIPLFVSISLIIASVSAGYYAARELVEPERQPSRLNEMHDEKHGEATRTTNLGPADGMEGSAREPPDRRRISGPPTVSDSRAGPRHAVGVH